MTFKVKIGFSILGTAAMLLLFGMGVSVNQVSAAAQEGNVYNVDIQPLSIQECARCHYSHFKRIRDKGGKHTQVTCTDCHDLFHAYNPLKGNYGDIMPKCTSCHGSNLPSPKYHTDTQALGKCLACHTDPHQPIASLADVSKLEPQCGTCHGAVKASLLAKPSAHTKEACSSCHSEKHGRIPNCSECHESHSPAVALNNPACLACHPVHTPLVISYPQNQDNVVCAGCHGQVYDQLQAKPTKHTQLSCAQCHPSHGQIMACSECHSETPHNPGIHQKFPQCKSCHNIAHDLHM